MLAVAIVGVTTGVLAGLLIRGAIGPLVGYDLAVLTYLAFIWATIWPRDAEATASHASRKDPSRPVADIALLSAAIASLVGVATLVAQAHSAQGSVRNTEISISIVSVVASWLLLHTIFTLKYARMYYGAAGDRAKPGSTSRTRSARRTPTSPTSRSPSV